MVVIKVDQKCCKILLVFCPDLVDQFFGADAELFRLEHDGGAVRIIGADVVTFMAAHFLETNPDICLNVFHQMPQMD